MRVLDTRIHDASVRRIVPDISALVAVIHQQMLERAAFTS